MEETAMRLCLLVLTLLLGAAVLAAEPRVRRDVAYVEPKDPKLTLDVYSPSAGKDHPVVLWIHGGGWQAGDKSEADHKPRAFTDRGYVFVSTNYRLLPTVTIKQMAADVAKAIRYTRDHAREWGGDPDRFIVTGHSAGAQLAALVCTDERYLKAEGLSFSFIKGCVPVDGDTYDVPLQIATVELRRADRYRMKFGDEASQKELSPVTHVARGKRIPPVLILHVAEHPETKLQSERLVKALTEAGVRARTYRANSTDHVKLNADLGLPDDQPSAEMFEFITRVLRR
jgi:arylformamidase